MQAVGPTRLWAALAMAAACVVCLWMAYGMPLALAYALLAMWWIGAATCSFEKTRAPASALGHKATPAAAHASTRGPATARGNWASPGQVPAASLESALSDPLNGSRAGPTARASHHNVKDKCDHADKHNAEPDSALAPPIQSCPVKGIQSTTGNRTETLHGRRFIVTHAAHSTGRHEATYVLAAACTVGICDVVGCALSDPIDDSGPEMVLLEPDGFITSFWRDGQLPIVGVREPLAAGDCVTVTLDAYTGSVHFSVNGIGIVPEVPLSPGGTYAFVTDDRATASTLTMIADRRLDLHAKEPCLSPGFC